MIELYVFPPSPRAFKVMAIANHLGIETKIRPLDLVKGEQKTSEYAALNPNMRMPTMKDGDTSSGNPAQSSNILQTKSRTAASSRRTSAHGLT